MTEMQFESRLSDSPLIERVWRAHSHYSQQLTSITAGHLELIIARHQGLTQVFIRGPETVVTEGAICPAEGEWLAIRFKAGTFLPGTPTQSLLNGQDLELPVQSDHFYWQNTAWELPSFDNVEALIKALQQAQLIQSDVLVTASLEGESLKVSQRTLQRRFKAITGLQIQTYQQIEKARHAASLLRSGQSILNTALATGYCDQSHLTHSLKRFIGLTPGEIIAKQRNLSFLYKNSLSPLC